MDNVIITTEERLASIIDARIESIIPKLKNYQLKNMGIIKDNLTIDEAVEFLKEKNYATTRASLYNRIHQRTIPYNKVKRRVYFSKRELEKWLNDETTTFEAKRSEMASRIAESARRHK